MPDFRGEILGGAIARLRVDAGSIRRESRPESDESQNQTGDKKQDRRAQQNQLKDDDIVEHLAGLIEKKAAEIGETDPLVYKITSVTACQHCYRIWGRRGSIRYHLSELERWEALGGNFHKPAREWRATIGPIHPNCMCGSLFLYTGDDLHTRMLAAVDEMVEEGKRMRAAAAAGG